MINIHIQERPLKPTVKGIFFSIDKDAGIDEPMIVLNTSLSQAEKRKTLRHELFHYCTELFLETKEYKVEVNTIKNPNIYIHEMIGHIGGMFGGEIEATVLEYFNKL